MVHGDFNYQAVQLACPGCIATGSNSYDKFRWGYTVGGGVSFGFITVEYLHTDLGTVDQTIPVLSTFFNPTPTSATGFATTSMKTQTDAIRVKFSMGL